MSVLSLATGPSCQPLGWPGDCRAGRYAPTPSGDLHIGNLRTALLAWLFARRTGRAFRLRIDDLDPDRSRDPAGQLADLAALGLTHDGPIVRQSARTSSYAKVLDGLIEEAWFMNAFAPAERLPKRRRLPIIRQGPIRGPAGH
ncbi:MAG: glutamate--tRNA ligase family protein [Marmoricola sp.]